MIITAIAAMDRTGLIGAGLKMPWHLPRDLKRFRQLTMGKPIILGRTTWESLGAPLPGRLNIVLSRQAVAAAGCQVAASIEDALQLARDHLALTCGTEAMIVGGGVVYKATSPLWDRLLLTVIDAVFDGDTYFPISAIQPGQWSLVGQEFCPADAKNPYSHWFLTLDRQRATEPAGAGFDLPAWLAARSPVSAPR